MIARFRLEVAVETVDDALTARVAGADRVELSSALDLGGLTPSVGLVEAVVAACKLPVWVMLRPRPGDFVYSDADHRVMLRDAERLAGCDPAGFVFGTLKDDGTIDADRCKALLAACGRPCVFHRAFDRCPDPAAAVETVISLGFVRILTSGRELTATAGAHAIKELGRRAAGRVEILPCGKVRAKNVAAVLEMTGCDQVHGSFAQPVPDLGGRGRRGYPPRTRVDFEDVQETRAVLDRLARGGTV